MADRLTIYQRLNKTLGNEVDGPKYVIDPSSFDGLNGSELDQKKLEAQQTLYLQNQWKKIDNELYQKLFIMNQQESRHIMIMRLWNIHQRFLLR